MGEQTQNPDKHLDRQFSQTHFATAGARQTHKLDQQMDRQFSKIYFAAERHGRGRKKIQSST